MCARIVSTYTVFTGTVDEPFHIACGMEWLDKGVYLLEAQHPPLSRVAGALGPYLAGERSNGIGDEIQQGNAILGSGATYTRNLTLARWGELPFVVLAFAGVWVWARHYFGYRAAFLAALLFSMVPAVLAHGGLATTDISVTAGCVWALYAWVRFLEEPNSKRSMLLGLWTGLALITKFTSILFLGCGFVVILIAYLTCTHNWKLVRIGNTVRAVRLAAPACVVAFLVVWACFRFTFAPLFSDAELTRRTADFSPSMSRPGLVHFAVTRVPVPAGEFFRGIGQVLRHNKGGQWSYLLGERRDSGWWYYFPVVLAIKTPLGFLLLALAGAVVLLRRLFRSADWKSAAPVLFVLVILLSCMPSRINIGVRHILPIYPLLAIMAGVFVSETLSRGRRLVTVAALACVAWCCTSSLLAHPDYLAYFNEIASRHPEHFLVDSDLDWGQDLGRFCIRMRQLNVPSVAFTYFGTAELNRFDLPPNHEISCQEELSGYVAISASQLYLARPVANQCPQRFVDLSNTKPVERIGKSIFLYYFPPRPH